MSESKELVVLPTAVVIYSGGVDAILEKIVSEVRSIPIDISTSVGRAQCASVAYRVARSKTTLDDMGKDLGEEWRAKIEAINADRRRIRETLDDLRDEVRAPLTEWEQTEKNRVQKHEDAIRHIQTLGEAEIPLAHSDITGRLDQLYAFCDGHPDWQEFAKRAADARELSVTRLVRAADEALSREKAEAEAARLEQERITRERHEREVRIAKAAAEQARRDAEEKAAREAAAAHAQAEAERRAIEEWARQAEARAKTAEAARVAADKKAKADAAEAARRAQEAKQKAERDRIEAIEAERRRVEVERQAEIAEIQRREADKTHRAMFNREARDAIAKIIERVERSDGDIEVAQALIEAIARREVPHIGISY